ncbi:hypothetical protein [Neobacillus sp. OS1-33]|uniref:hypothetical protein n=1 Tax=Neobacillus sp. OS1-33 TaxID=3070683 RepID=UPI0027DF22DC|nr:hypothetical protein [Neobacillus sp. OS1-33]WML26256.1 hypothetical protein RCG22_01005 [Neobacillus sp. OS1-33]
MIQIKTVAHFNNPENRFIVITDTTGQMIHKVPLCRTVTQEKFEEKVILNQCKNGKYFDVNSYDEAKRQWGRIKTCDYCFN